MMIIRGVNQPPVEVLLEMQHTHQQQLVKKKKGLYYLYYR